MKSLPFILLVLLFYGLSSAGGCSKQNDKEEIQENQDLFELCIDFGDSRYQAFNPFVDASVVKEYYEELPYFTTNHGTQGNDEIGFSFTNFILMEDAYNESTQQNEVLFHLLYEGRGLVHDIVLNCHGENVSDEKIDHADLAIEAYGDFHLNNIQYPKYRYYLLQE